MRADDSSTALTRVELPDNLPSIADAKLPAVYEAAKTALAECSRVDECKDWADQAQALASYAKQAHDDTLRKTADRIQARAIRRCGELLREVKPARGQGAGRPPSEPKKITDGQPSIISPPTRTAVAREAGLSRNQQATALRVAAVPEDEFEAVVESESPPTVTELAARGTQKKPPPLVDLGGRDPVEFRLSTEAQGHIERLADLVGRVAPAVVFRGAYEHERAVMKPRLQAIADWSLELLAHLQGDAT